MSNEPVTLNSKSFFANLIVHVRSEILSCLAAYTYASPLEREKVDTKIGFGSSLRCIDVWQLFASDELINIAHYLERQTDTSFIEWFDVIPPEFETLLARDIRILEAQKNHV